MRSIERTNTPLSWTTVFSLAVAAFFAVGGSADAQQLEHLSITQPGGFPGMPVITGIEKKTNGVKLTWDGPAGYYYVYRKLGLLDENWQSVAGPNLNRTTTITNGSGDALFRVAGPGPHYAGSQACIECHGNIHATEMETSHTRALDTLKRIGQHQNPSCLRCHTVGFGLPTGFVSEAATPHLAGVQCESCHGPAGNHAANPEDFSVRPRVEIAATVCGGCHTDSHQPTFEEWSMTGHAGVVEDMSPAGRINSCGRCHSATARFTLLNGGNPLTVTNDANVGIVCVTCHDPHANHVWTNVLHGVITNFLNNIPIVFTNNKVGPVYTNQLRNPVASTNDYFLTTGEAFTNKYNANINTCAQCHNHRGAVWTSSARAPHHSPQYNMLLGTVGELPAGTPRRHRATHALMEKQCAGCHMQTTAHMNGPPEVAADTGHKFAVDKFEACAQCHVSAANGEASAVFWSGNIANQIQQVKSYLDFWAMTKAPASLWAAYGTRAWEYSTPGDLSPGGSSPNAVEQAQIPDNIKRARFNLYIVLYDGSHGIHNPVHTVALLEAATSWIQTELNN